MKRVLFTDRDGTLIVEPESDCQVDSYDKLRFYPGAISAMSLIAKLDYLLVMVTNQDGLGTDRFPYESFIGPHNLMLRTLEGEGVRFDDILIDRTYEQQYAPTRKPQTGMLTRYLTDQYDLPNSYVIGDRTTDVALAKNIGCKAILLQPKQQGLRMVGESGLGDYCALVTDCWDEIYAFLRQGDRAVSIERVTAETNISLRIDLDGNFESKIATGLSFFDHLLEQIVHHGGIAIDLSAKGDLDVDEHHTIEDCAIVLGEAISKALGSKAGIARYGFVLPMDEANATVLIDLGGRPDFVWDAEFRRERVGDVPTEMFSHFFKSFAYSARCNLHISVRGENEHHKIEAVFKAFARALRCAIDRNPFKYDIPTSKGIL